MLYRLMAAMRGGAVENIVVSMTPGGGTADKIRNLGIEVETLRMQPGRADPRGLVRLARILWAWRPDILQTWLYHADLLGLLAAKFSGNPDVVWNIRCSKTDARYYSGMSGFVVRTLARLSPLPAAVVANSVAGVKLHTEIGYRPRRWEVVPNGFDLQQYRPDPEARGAIRQELNIPDGDPVIGLIARLDPLKDHSTFLRAAALLLEIHPSVRFVLAGAGVTAQNFPFAQALATNDFAGRLHLLGHRTDIPQLTAALDVATCCSTGEGFPNIIGEAMACGVPIVTTDVGDAAVVMAGAGLVIPPADAPALAAAWRGLLEMPAEKRASAAERSRARIQHQYEIRKIAGLYEHLYQEISGQMQNQ